MVQRRTTPFKQNAHGICNKSPVQDKCLKSLTEFPHRLRREACCMAE